LLLQVGLASESRLRQCRRGALSRFVARSRFSCFCRTYTGSCVHMHTQVHVSGRLCTTGSNVHVHRQVPMSAYAHSVLVFTARTKRVFFTTLRPTLNRNIFGNRAWKHNEMRRNR